MKRLLRGPVEASNFIRGRKSSHPDYPVQLFGENMARIERGEDPMGVIRDSTKNEPMIRVVRAHERPKAFYTFDCMFQESDRPQHRG